MRGNDKQRIESASLRTKYIWVAVITMSTIVYLIPYTYLDFYNPFLEAFQITDGQSGKIMTFFGLTAAPGYFIGGWLADKFNPKKLVVVSTFPHHATGIQTPMEWSLSVGKTNQCTALFQSTDLLSNK